MVNVVVHNLPSSGRHVAVLQMLSWHLTTTVPIIETKGFGVHGQSVAVETVGNGGLHTGHRV